MNYKIRITAENQAIVKRIADENGMNPYNLEFVIINFIYEIENNIFRCRHKEFIPKNATELSTDQFIQLFDKKETELDKWLKETKAKNLSFHDLEHLIFELQNPLFSNLEGSNFTEKAEFLYNQWNNRTKPHICKYCQAETTQDDETCYAKPTEWQPKRGDRVLVWNNNEEMAREAIYFDTDKFVICFWDEKEFENYSNSNCFRLGNYCHMKPLPIEQPIETDFKTKVIELINEKINETTLYFEQQLTLKQYSSASQYKDEVSILDDLLIQIKQL